jgi:hypothetical protein
MMTFTPLSLSGLPHGAVLLTTLFSLYLSDIPHSPHTRLILYIEDTALLSQSWHLDILFRRLSQAVTTLLNTSLNENSDLIPTELKPYFFLSAAPLSWAFSKFVTPLCPGPWQYNI